MTPQEIVKPILNMVFSDLVMDKEFLYNLEHKPEKIIVMDPTCGVGTLIIEGLKILTHYVHNLNTTKKIKDDIVLKLKENSIIGQDKVTRMVKLSKINMLLEGANSSNIHLGNSILGNSKINKYFNKVSLIITNPPFGARFSLEEFRGDKYFPIINRMIDKGYKGNIDSELTLLDKSIALLKENGKLLIVVPDSVISAEGIYKNFREELIRLCNIKAVINLPATAFAQAGTRTKTSILYLEKKEVNDANIFMATCSNLGYVVKERMGVPVKFSDGFNEMEGISKMYIESLGTTDISSFKILNKNPEVSIIKQSMLKDNALTPNLYSFNILENSNFIIKNEQLGILKLSDLVTFESKNRKKKLTNEEIKHISLLHINQDGTINFKEVEEFNPISKGNECFENDILFSKLNPRILRVAIVPKYDKKLVCSNEFEILRAKQGINPYIIYKLLTMSEIRNQIESLTTGTSSSHNRVKATKLAEIIIPFPKKNTKLLEDFNEKADEIEKSFIKKYEIEKNLDEIGKEIRDILF